MSFSSSFCLTNIGSLQLGTSVDFYSDVDNYTTPFQTDILLSDITGNNCPYLLTNIPNGTTTIQILDVNSSCCVSIPVSTFTCDDCNFGFNVYSSVTFNSRIVAGNLTASCDNNITDYVIEWFNINDLTTPLYVSGLGDEFEQYQTWTFPHPLTGNTSIPVTSGTYVPVIKYVRLNGINYSSDLENGLVQIPLQNCLSETTIIVQPLTCDNGTNIGDYTHLLQFSGSSQGEPPELLSSTFILSQSTNYFVWRFNAFDVQDTLKITYYGSYYNNSPIVLEYWNVGNDNTFNNFSNSVNPKVVRTYSSSKPGFNKVTCLTGLTRSVNDYLIIEIIPNQLNSKTDFQFYFKCLESFDCETCFDNYINTPYKIKGSSITGNTLSCNRIQIQFQLSGCTLNDITNTDYYKYYYTLGVPFPPYNMPGQLTGNNGLVSTFTYHYINNTSCSKNWFPLQTSCQPYINNGNNTITFNKDLSGVGGIGNTYLTFSNYDDFLAFYTSYQQRISQAGIISDPTNIGFYRYITMKMPVLSLNPDEALVEECGDTTVFRTDYIFHTSSQATTGTTSNGWFLNITMPTISKQMSFTNCELNCDFYINDIVLQINSSSTGSTNNISWINEKGNRVNIPFYEYAIVNYGTLTTTGTTFAGSEYISNFLNKTLPMSGTNYTTIPSLSAKTCNLIGQYQPNSLLNNNDWYSKFQYLYSVESTNSSDIEDFKILAQTLSNGVPTGNYFRIWEISGGTVIYSDSNYIF